MEFGSDNSHRAFVNVLLLIKLIKSVIFPIALVSVEYSCLTTKLMIWPRQRNLVPFASDLRSASRLSTAVLLLALALSRM